MLLAEPFEPFNEQKQKKSFFSWFPFFAKTKQALNNMRNRRQISRQMQAMLMNQQLMLPPPPHPTGLPQPPMYCCYYDPYMTPFMFSPPIFPPPPLPLPPQQMPFICVHFDSPMEEYRFPQNPINTSPNSDSTLYSTMSLGEKEQVDDYDDVSSEDSQNSNAGHSIMMPRLTRSYSDMLYDRPIPSHRWSTSNVNYYV